VDSSSGASYPKALECPRNRVNSTSDEVAHLGEAVCGSRALGVVDMGAVAPASCRAARLADEVDRPLPTVEPDSCRISEVKS